MPRQLFDHVVTPRIRLGSRQWYTLPLSLISHVAVLGVLVAAPIVATHALPTPESVMVFVTALPLPEPPVPMAPASAPPVTEPVVAVVNPSTPSVSAVEVPSEASRVPTLGDWSTRTASADVAIGTGRSVPLAPAPALAAPAKQNSVLPVGGDVRAPIKLHDVPPVYPRVARSARAQGVVVLEAIIDRGGLVRNVRVVQSVPLLDQAAVDAVRQWRYSTPTLNGVPVDVSMTVRVSFHLQ